jgi:flagellar basal body-associated protein FliL
MDKEKKKAIINIIFLIVLIIAICALIGTIITINKYDTMLKNPLGYSLKYFNISSCSYIKDGAIVFINATG